MVVLLTFFLNIFSDIKHCFTTIGFECLVKFDEPFVYPTLIKEFFMNMLVGRNEIGDIFFTTAVKEKF